MLEKNIRSETESVPPRVRDGMIKLENEQNREAEEEAVGGQGLYGIQHSPPVHPLTTTKKRLNSIQYSL